MGPPTRAGWRVLLPESRITPEAKDRISLVRYLARVAASLATGRTQRPDEGVEVGGEEDLSRAIVFFLHDVFLGLCCFVLPCLALVLPASQSGHLMRSCKRYIWCVVPEAELRFCPI